MKLVLAIFSLVILVFGLAIFADVIQGNGVFEAISAFKKIRHTIGPEEYMLIILFFLPLIGSKINQFRTKLE